ncbi:MAG: Transcriptional regulator, AcrR family, partial [uncultured Corynebacteriales bacterium]
GRHAQPPGPGPGGDRRRDQGHRAADPGRRGAGRAVAAGHRPRDGDDRARALPLLPQPRGPRHRADRGPVRRAGRGDGGGPGRGRGRRVGAGRPGRAAAAGRGQPRLPALGAGEPARVRPAVRQPDPRRGDREVRRRRPGPPGGAPLRPGVRRAGRRPLPEPAVPGPGRRGHPPAAARRAGQLVPGLPRPAAPGRGAGVPVLLDQALRRGRDGGLRPPAVRPHRRRADVRAGAAGPRVEAGARVDRLHLRL